MNLITFINITTFNIKSVTEIISHGLCRITLIFTRVKFGTDSTEFIKCMSKKKFPHWVSNPSE